MNLCARTELIYSRVDLNLVLQYLYSSREGFLLCLPLSQLLKISTVRCDVRPYYSADDKIYAHQLIIKILAHAHKRFMRTN
jgi:hypothetical protein